MAGGASGDNDDIISGINVTPLVDVVLVLLIILMVTATAIVSKTIPMELPQATPDGAPPSSPTTLDISIDAEGALFLDRNPVSEDELRAAVREARQQDPETRAIIAGHAGIAYARVVHVIDILRQLDVTKFAISVTEPASAAE